LGVRLQSGKVRLYINKYVCRDAYGRDDVGIVPYVITTGVGVVRTMRESPIRRFREPEQSGRADRRSGRTQFAPTGVDLIQHIWYYQIWHIRRMGFGIHSRAGNDRPYEVAAR